MQEAKMYIQSKKNKLAGDSHREGFRLASCIPSLLCFINLEAR